MYEHSSRPHLYLKYSIPELAGEFLSLAGILLNAYIVANQWTLLPEQVPYFDSFHVHKIWLLAVLSLLPIGIYIILTLLSRRLDRFFYPAIVTEKNAAAQYRLARDMLLSLKLEVVFSSIVAEWYFIRMASGHYSSAALIIAFILVVLAAIIVTFAYYIRRMHRNA